MEIDIVDLDHVVIRVTDLEQSIVFYHDLLGLPIKDRERYDAGEVPYVAVVAGGRQLHLVPASGPIDAAGEHFCLLVRSSSVDAKAELDALLDTLRQAGVNVEKGEPRKRYGSYGRAWSAYVRDPDGRRVELKIH